MSSSLNLFSLSLIWVLFSFLALAAAQQNDQATMVALGKELSFSNWGNESSDCCTWVGVKCNINNLVEGLDLSMKHLKGNVTLVSELKALRNLTLSRNGFTGPLPSAFGNLLQLEILDLSFNSFDGVIPVAFGNLIKLRSLNLSNNRLMGRIPDELRSLENLSELQLFRNNFTASIPDWVGNLTKLRVFTAYENRLDGKIPSDVFAELVVLNLHSNLLEGNIPEGIFSSGKLQVLVLTDNKLDGSLHPSIGHCKGLSSIRIGLNRLIGDLPTSIGNITSLTYLEADGNHMSGEIVSELGQCTNLSLLNLASNGFTGTIPSQLGELQNLQELILSDNSLFGDIPNSLVQLKNLSKLDLSRNRLNGTIPAEICNMPKLQYLLLSQNSMHGGIPREIGNCKLLELQIGGNYLTGSIPPEIGQVRNLQIALNLSVNYLHGPLPVELGKLDKLVTLDVSNNQLTGKIPPALMGMESLIVVNFSYNLLSGPVPDFGPFRKSPNSSFTGNKGLCGAPLSSHCGKVDPSETGRYHHKVSVRIILAVVGSGLTVFIMVTVVVVLFMMRERQEKASKAAEIAENGNVDPPLIIAGNVFVENLQQAIDFDAVIQATLKDSNKISNGTFSTIYKAVMPSGLTLSVKKLKSMDRTLVHYQTKMIRELERLGKLYHDNLIRPIGFVIYEDVALLLHPYLPNGTLSELLLSSPTKPDFKPDWTRRLSISIGAAEGLAFLHNVAIIHLDISSSNIFLDANYKALLGEIEISKLLDPSRGTASISAVAGSFGYIPPEYAYTMQMTAPGNVYSYGVVLLEILTSCLPVDEAFGEGIDLVKWVHNAPSRGETPEQILDAKLSTVSYAWRKQMLAVLKVALLCTEVTPAKRPKMKKVVEMLQEINGS